MEDAEIHHPFQCSALALANTSNGPRVLLAAKENLYLADVADTPRLIDHWKPEEAKNQTAITLLAASTSGKFCAVVLGDEKKVQVFDVADKLVPGIGYTLPKRPCAIAFSPNDSHLLCGDKFGDVYALPTATGGLEEPARKKLKTWRPGAPAATNLTVHTKGNLQALEHQRRLAAKAAKAGNSAKEPEQASPESSFPFDPVIGHVSMLTEIIATHLRPETFSDTDNMPSKVRDYIFTADRDEHIRISRGLPQSHVIEGFCLQHEQFVNKLCIPRSDILVSGGGDSYLCIWNWQQSELLSKVKLSGYLPFGESGGPEKKVGVTGLWALPSMPDVAGLLCSCEGWPLLLCVQWKKTVQRPSSADIRVDFIALPGNALGAVVLPLSSTGEVTLLACLDNIHQAGSIKAARESEALGHRLQVLRGSISYAVLSFDDIDKNFAARLDACCKPQSIVQNAQILTSQVSRLLYGVENLRKRGGEDVDDEGKQDGQ